MTLEFLLLSFSFYILKYLVQLSLNIQEMLVTPHIAFLIYMCTCIFSNHCHNIPEFKKCLFHEKGRNVIYKYTNIYTKEQSILFKRDSESNLLCPNHCPASVNPRHLVVGKGHLWRWSLVSGATWSRLLLASQIYYLVSEIQLR